MEALGTKLTDYLLAGTATIGAMVRFGPPLTGRPVAAPTLTSAHSPTSLSATGTHESSLGERDEKLEGIEAENQREKFTICFPLEEGNIIVDDLDNPICKLNA